VQEEILNKMSLLNETEWLELNDTRRSDIRSCGGGWYVQIAEAVLSHMNAWMEQNIERIEEGGHPAASQDLAVAEAYDTMIYGDLYKNPSGRQLRGRN